MPSSKVLDVLQGVPAEPMTCFQPPCPSPSPTTTPAPSFTPYPPSRQVLAVLSYAHEAGVDPFLEPSLELCMVLLEVFSRQATGGAPAGCTFQLSLRGSTGSFERRHMATAIRELAVLGKRNWSHRLKSPHHWPPSLALTPPGSIAPGAEETSKFLPALPLLLELCAHSDPSVAAAAAACLAGVAQLHPEDAAAILAADNGFALMAGVLQPRDGGAPNEAAAYHLLHALVGLLGECVWQGSRARVGWRHLGHWRAT